MTPRGRASPKEQFISNDLEKELPKSGSRSPIEVQDVIEYDSDDVFANNPSNLMLAKVKVKKRVGSEPPP